MTMTPAEWSEAHAALANGFLSTLLIASTPAREAIAAKYPHLRVVDAYRRHALELATMTLASA